MDAGCYCAHSLRFFPGCSRPKVCCCSCVQALKAEAICHAHLACIAGRAVLDTRTNVYNMRNIHAQHA